MKRGMLRRVCNHRAGKKLYNHKWNSHVIYKNESYGNKFFDAGAKRCYHGGHTWDGVDWCLAGALTFFGGLIVNEIIHYSRDHVQWSERRQKEEFENLLTDRKTQDSKLHAAVRLNMPKTLKKCIKRGEDINAENKLGQTAIELAVYNYREDCLKILLEHGVKADHIDPETGNSLLQHIILNQNIEMAKQLVPHVDANNVNLDAENALHMAIRVFKHWSRAGYKKNEEDTYILVEQLLEAGVDLDQQSNEGHAPLHSAVILGDLEMLEIFTKDVSKLNPWLKNKEGLNPFEMYMHEKQGCDESSVGKNREYNLLRKFYEDSDAYLQKLCAHQEVIFAEDVVVC